MTTSGTPTPRRKADLPPLRRLSRNVLVIGTVVAVVAAFGPGWAARLGVVVAVGAAVVACAAAWREVAEQRRSHAAELKTATKAHGAALSKERQHNASVLETLTDRSRAAEQQISGQQASIVDLTAKIVELTSTLGSLRSELSSVQENYAHAQGETQQRDAVIASLQETLAAREAELQALSEARAQVRAIPRRMLAEYDAVPAREQSAPAGGAAESGPAARARQLEEALADPRRPSVTDLVDEVPVVLPNYEGDRLLA